MFYNTITAFIFTFFQIQILGTNVLPCKRSNELSNSITGELIKRLDIYQLLRRNYAPWS
jgi:hypothetical protein